MKIDGDFYQTRPTDAMVVGAMLLSGSSAGLGIPKSPSFHSGLELAAAAKDFTAYQQHSLTGGSINTNTNIISTTIDVSPPADEEMPSNLDNKVAVLPLHTFFFYIFIFFVPRCYAPEIADKRNGC